MIETSALVPVSEAISACLNVPALIDQGIIVYDQIPAEKSFPCVAYIVSEDQWRSFGQPGKTVELRIHAFTRYEGMRTAQGILDTIIDLLAAATAETMPMDGWRFQWADHLGTSPMPDEIVNGQITQHLQARWMLTVTETDTINPLLKHA